MYFYLFRVLSLDAERMRKAKRFMCNTRDTFDENNSDCVLLYSNVYAKRLKRYSSKTYMYEGQGYFTLLEVDLGFLYKVEYKT